jgi:hypothetical protein
MPRAVSNIDWKRIAFWVFLWWCIYSAPTEGSLTDLLSHSTAARNADTF